MMQNCGGRRPATLLVLRVAQSREQSSRMPSLKNIIQRISRCENNRILLDFFFTTYAREFSKLKRFAPELVNTDYRTARKFVLGLDTKIRNIVEAIAPTTYATALRAGKAMEGPNSSRESPSSPMG